MRILSIVAVVLVVIAAVIIAGKIPGRADRSGGAPIVVELFTSEGCSSCPPADKLLAELEKRGSVNGRQILVMGEHVDYWNELGWKDRFSSAIFSQRQTEYVRKLGVDSPYTPQMVINGRTELVGNDEAALMRGLEKQEAGGSTEVALQVDATSVANVKVQGAKPGSKILLAITEGKLSTHVQRGENGGRDLLHTGVVRLLHEIGSAKSGSFEGSIPLKLDSTWHKENIRVIVLVQDSAGGPIEGAAHSTLP
jgi:hypothetical protein